MHLCGVLPVHRCRVVDASVQSASSASAQGGSVVCPRSTCIGRHRCRVMLCAWVIGLRARP
eukprot:8386289-Alexandrium_andersonii.AAC.1